MLKKAKIHYLLAIPLLIIMLYFLLWLIDFLIPVPDQKVKYGITFSPTYTQSLGLDINKTYLALIDDLKVKNIRIPISWNEVETSPNNFDFQKYDDLLSLSKDKSVQIILAIGYKVPRWPECYSPDFYQGLDEQDFAQKVLQNLEKTVQHFKNNSQITAWQVENEPLLRFGPCRKPNPKLLKQEIELVRSLDSKPVVITDSGELTNWIVPLQLSDQTGISLYRYGWDPILGFHSYPIPSLFYQVKQFLVKTIYAPQSQNIFIAELQSEPWTAGTALINTPLEEQVKLFDLNKFQDNIIFAKKTGAKEIYLWGAEWWYFMKEKGYPEYWNFSKTLF